ncbi:zinc-binding dehydrogenase [Pseudonocardia sp. ICBG1293]|uniref:zinc-binding dehydrogenase n=1 Tax=Pseudonocardia sp. ICBG1293 TaxID=2844382 RepID=UPI001CCFF86E|nr:zinc-binding dehydrogenase [Pseudonocardia sp. ICBG1293]
MNPGEVRALAEAPAGSVHGWEAAGTVETPAADGSGPAAGAVVVTLGTGGGWAELRAVPTALLGTVRVEDPAPGGAPDHAALATLPIAGASALRALRDSGPLLGRRVLVTGATGGVGRFAVQLAALGGAEVLATARDAAAADTLRRLGATAVLTRPSELDAPVDAVLDTVGGPVLVEAFAALGSDGTLVSVGRASGRDAVLPADALLGDGSRHGRSIRTFFLLDGRPGLDRDLSRLAALLVRGGLRAAVDRVVTFAEAPAALAGRRPGKLVLLPHGPGGPSLAR